MDLGLAGRGATERTGSIPDRRAVAHSGWVSGVLSLSVSVDVVARQRHAAPTTKVWSCRRFWELRCAGGDGAGGWTSGWRGEGPRRRVRGRFLIAGLLRTAVCTQASSLSPYPLTWWRGSGTRRRQPRCGAAADFGNCGAPAAMELADGPRAGGARGHRAYGVDSLIAGLLRTAVCISGVLSLSVSVDVVARQRHAAPTTKVWSCRRFWELRCAGGDGAGGWTSGWRGEGPPSVRGRFLIAGLLRTAVCTQASSLSPYPLTWWRGSGTRRRQPRCGAAADFGNCVRRRRWSWRMDLGLAGRGATEVRGRFPDRRAVAHSGLYSGVLSLSVSVDVVARQRHAAPTTKVWSCRRFWELRCAGGDGAGGWTSGWRGEGPPSVRGRFPDRRAVAHSGLYYSGVLSLSVSVDVVARQRHAAPTTKVWSCRRFWELRAPAAMELADGPRAGGARGHRGTGSIP